MNKELFMVFLPGISSILFALGGTQISENMGGWKGWRRFILPFVYLGFCLLAVVWWKALLVSMIAGLAFTLGYGKGKTWLYRGLIGLLYGLISVPIGLSFWNIVTAVSFILFFRLSNWKPVSDIFVWKICEAVFGFTVGIEIAYLLLGKGLIW